ncbi:PspC domain-containing protein [Timonella sp. A28]|uniref:PspC domain-containing protein n=1 Tax=Timonella sp. A28 TaxID=3442640 RepID=UPI003EB6DC88
MENVHNTTGQPEGTGPGNTNGWMPPEHNNPKEGNHGGKKFFDSIRQSGFFRSETRWIGGVAGGLARRLNIDPIIVRAGLVVLALFSGLGLLLYAAAWALLPEERDGRIHMEEAIRGNFNGALIGAGIFAILGLGALNSLFFFGKNIPWEFTVLFWIGLTIASIYIISQVKDGELGRNRRLSTNLPTNSRSHTTPRMHPTRLLRKPRIRTTACTNVLMKQHRCLQCIRPTATLHHIACTMSLLPKLHLNLNSGRHTDITLNSPRPRHKIPQRLMRGIGLHQKK